MSFNGGFHRHAQKLSGRAKTFQVAMPPCHMGFSDSGLSIQYNSIAFHTIQYHCTVYNTKPLVCNICNTIPYWNNAMVGSLYIAFGHHQPISALSHLCLFPLFFLLFVWEGCREKTLKKSGLLPNPPPQKMTILHSYGGGLANWTELKSGDYIWKVSMRELVSNTFYYIRAPHALGWRA